MLVGSFCRLPSAEASSEFPCQLLHIHVDEVLLPFPSLLRGSAPWLCSGSSEGPPWPRASLFLSCPWSPSLLTLSPLLVFRPSWQEPGLLHSLVWIRSGASTRTACRVRGALVRGPHPAQRAFRADAQASFAASFFSWVSIGIGFYTGLPQKLHPQTVMALKCASQSECYVELCFFLATFLILLDICVSRTDFLTRAKVARDLVTKEQLLN